MPFVIPIIIGLGLAGAGAGAAIAAGTLTATLWGISALTFILTGASLLIGGITQMLNRPPSVSSLVNDQANHAVSVRQAAAPRVVIRGRAHLGGIITYLCSTSTNAGNLHMVITWAGHECDAVEEYWFDDYKLQLDGSGNEIGKYAGVVLVETKLGAPGEAAFPQLITATSGQPGAWTSAHTQDGCCSTHFRLHWDATKFTNGAPQSIRATIRGKKVFDPRTSTTAWSQNLALHIRDHMTDRKFGLRAQPWEIDDTSFIAAANLADEAVAVLVGGTEARYTCNGLYDSSKTVGDILTGLLSSGAGKMPWVGGQWKLFLGAWRTPTGAVLSDGDFRGGLTYTARLSRRDAFNGVKGVFLFPGNAWSSSDFPAMVRASYVADDNGITGTTDRGYWATSTAYALNDAVMNNGYAYVCTSAHTSGGSTEPGVGASWMTKWEDAGEIAWKDVEYPFVISPSTAQRLAKIELESGRRQGQLAAPCKLGAYQAAPPDVVQVTKSNYGWTAKTFELQTATLAVESDMALGVDLAMRESDANQYAWSTADELPMTGATVPLQGDPQTVQPCTALTIESGPADATVGADGISVPRIGVFWDSPADQFVLEGGKIFVEYKQHVDTLWTVLPEFIGTTVTCYIAGVNGGVYYDVRVRPRNSYGVFGAYAEADNLLASTTISSIVQEALSPTSIGNKNSTIVGGVSPLTSIDAGAAATISVAAFALQFGFGQVSFNSGSISGLSYSTGYYVYFDDATVPLAGGAETYQASVNFEDVLAGRHRVYVGWINTPAHGGGGTGGGGLGGGCPTIDQYDINGRQMADVKIGDFQICHAGSGETYLHPIELAFEWKRRACVRVTCANGVELELSIDTEIHFENATSAAAQYSLGGVMFTTIDDAPEWSKIIDVTHIGYQWVREIYMGKREFGHGSKPGRLGFTHNSPIGGNPK